MPKTRSWTDEDLVSAVHVSRSYRMVISSLGLIPAGGNYDQVQRRIKELGLDTKHFTGKGWNLGGKFVPKPAPPLESLMVKSSFVQSYKLKTRLIREGLKESKCEICGWNQQSVDGRIPVELDHVNGNKTDNRLENLRILCPNCHSLQPTHRGKNKKARLSKLG